MRMARAFIASVPMGIVLVAALVVPLAVIPGTFGFDRWPSSRGERVTESQVRLAPPKVAVVQVHRRSAPAPQRALASVNTGTSAAPPAPRVVVASVAAPRRAAVAPAPAPSPQPDRGPRNAPPRPTHQQSQTQQQPQQPQQPSKNAPGFLAGGAPPVARQL